MKANATVEEIRKTEGFNGQVEAYLLDLASIKSIRKFVEFFESVEERLDILINNAGMCNDPILGINLNIVQERKC